MKFAIIKTGGKQYLVEEGKTYTFEKIDQKEGAAVSFAEVLMFSDGKKVEFGKPHLKGVSVKGSIVAQGKAKKINVIKFKSKIRYRRRRGHRQPITKVKIASITAGK